MSLFREECEDWGERKIEDHHCLKKEKRGNRSRGRYRRRIKGGERGLGDEWGTVLELQGYLQVELNVSFRSTGEHGNSVQCQQIYIEYLLYYS